MARPLDSRVIAAQKLASLVVSDDKIAVVVQKRTVSIAVVLMALDVPLSLNPVLHQNGIVADNLHVTEHIGGRHIGGVCRLTTVIGAKNSV